MNPLAKNQKADYDYEILERFEAGLELFGHEVKSIKTGRATLEGSRVIIRGGEAYLVGAQIRPYQPQNLPPGYSPDRTIKLLLTKKEIKHLAGAGERQGLTIIPLAIYNKNSRLKLELALARGKKKYDKREIIKKREADRQIARTLKRQRI
jgi:SsrA-binding protein